MVSVGSRAPGGGANAFMDALVPDQALDAGLRPRTLDEFVGQRRLVSNLELSIRAARDRGESLDHVLLSGLPGLGKTTLAHLIAGAADGQLHEAAAPALQRAADLAGLLTRLEPGDTLFIDEVHRLPPGVEEYLYAAMEDFVLDVVIDQGPAARSIRIELPRFTLVGATTREGLLSAPFRGRFGIHERLDPYDTDDLAAIVRRSAGILGVVIDADAATAIGERSRGTPRVANRFLRRIRDFAQIEAGNHITTPVALGALDRLGVDRHGLTEVDRSILRTLHRAGRPIGLKSISAAVGEDDRTLEDVYEPFLLREGLVVKTPQGRSITHHGVAAVGDGSLEGGPPRAQGDLPL